MNNLCEYQQQANSKQPEYIVDEGGPQGMMQKFGAWTVALYISVRDFSSVALDFLVTIVLQSTPDFRKFF